MTNSSRAELDFAVNSVVRGTKKFALMGPSTKARLLRQVIGTIVDSAHFWVKEACKAKRISFGSTRSGEEWLAGPVVTVRNARLLAESLEQIASSDTPSFGRGSRIREDGILEVETFPTCRTDGAAASGFSCRVRYAHGVRREDAIALQASEYRNGRERRRKEVCLVLGAGNVSSIPAMDVLSKMFVEGYVCVLKMNPVNEWLGPVLMHALRPLVELGLLRIVYGGAEEGSYLCTHASVNAIHITGSGATHDAIVWGPSGPERDRRMVENDPLTGERVITSELGNVSPVLITPGEYSKAELVTMAWNIVSMKVNNASCNCNAAQVLVTAEGWHQREQFLDMLSTTFSKVPSRFAYYPGNEERFRRLVDGRVQCPPAVEEGHLPWTLIANLDFDDHTETLFKEEAFCPILAETTVPGEHADEFLYAATRFANARLFGTLNATLMVPPFVENDSTFNPAIERAIDDLQYGSVVVNHWAGIAYGLVSPPWGAAPGHTLKSPGSGIGWVHNTYMLEGMEKTVVRGPFTPSPKPPWFANHGNVHEIGRKLVRFEASPSWLKLPGLATAALKG